MNGNLTELISRYTITYDRKIKRWCAPLKDQLGISTFAYYTLQEEGRFCIFSNYPEQLDFFYQNKLYQICPYLTHPRFFRSGCALIPLTPDSSSQKISVQLHQMDHLFLILQRSGNQLEGFFFINPHLQKNSPLPFLNKLDLLQKFGRYFKREAKPLIQNALDDGYSLSKAKGKAFYERDPNLPLSSQDPTLKQFLKQTEKLSPQEEKCLDLFKQGKSAKDSAKLLGLSKRTIEHYFENIKDKLGCNSKWDLLNY